MLLVDIDVSSLILIGCIAHVKTDMLWKHWLIQPSSNLRKWLTLQLVICSSKSKPHWKLPSCPFAVPSDKYNATSMASLDVAPSGMHWPWYVIRSNRVPLHNTSNEVLFLRSNKGTQIFKSKPHCRIINNTYLYTLYWHTDMVHSWLSDRVEIFHGNSHRFIIIC